MEDLQGKKFWKSDLSRTANEALILGIWKGLCKPRPCMESCRIDFWLYIDILFGPKKALREYEETALWAKEAESAKPYIEMRQNRGESVCFRAQ